MDICSTILFAAATQVVVIHNDRAEIMHISQYHAEQHHGAFVWYCKGHPLPIEISAGKITWTADDNEST